MCAGPTLSIALCVFLNKGELNLCNSRSWAHTLSFLWGNGSGLRALCLQPRTALIGSPLSSSSQPRASLSIKPLEGSLQQLFSQWSFQKCIKKLNLEKKANGIECWLSFKCVYIIGNPIKMLMSGLLDPLLSLGNHYLFAGLFYGTRNST